MPDWTTESAALTTWAAVVLCLSLGSSACDAPGAATPSGSSPPAASEAPAASARPGSSSGPSSARESAIVRATDCATKQHRGLGIWKSPLLFDGPDAWETPSGWMVAFKEKEPKGKPQGLTLILKSDGSCERANVE
ncbi:MAG: hypothetical protein IPM79_18975 [Polyangiaceae bacterium]|nr:hypothetical protein [Polyangiaceae bacterium]